MARLKRWNTAPPGGYRYFQTETQLEIKAENGEQLLDLVIAHRAFKNLQPQDRSMVRLDVERQLCSQLGYGDCRPEGKEDRWKPIDGSQPMVGMTQVIAFSKAAIEFIVSGGELAPMEEVRRRADICRACVFNRALTGCSCSVFYKILDASIPSSRKLDGLFVCGICHCSNAVKVNLTEEQVLASNDGRDLAWPVETPCWQAELSAKAAAKASLQSASPV